VGPGMKMNTKAALPNVQGHACTLADPLGKPAFLLGSDLPNSVANRN